MSATVHTLPIVSRIRPEDPAWREQFDREIDAVHAAMAERPHWTRPLLDGHRPNDTERNL